MIKWRYITSETGSVSSVLAADEYLMHRYGNWTDNDFPEPILRICKLGRNSVLIGRFQNPEAEVNIGECSRLGIDVNRRMTGGGAILMGRQQLLISIPCSVDHPLIPAHPARILPKLAKGIITGLSMLGIEAEYRPKNDIVVNGRKIGGSAICIEKTGAFLYQASVLVDFDIPLMMKVLNLHPEKISDKGIQSFDERLTTVNRELGKSLDINHVRESICRGFEQAFKVNAVHMPFNQAELDEIRELECNKYLTNEWLYQRMPASDMIGSCIMKTPAGLIHTYVALMGDTIKSVLITGDFFSDYRVVKDIEAALKWGRSDKDTIIRTINVVVADKGDSIQGLSAEELASAISSAASNAQAIESNRSGVKNAGTSISTDRLDSPGQE
ncbi:MAG: lipoate--protein ligase family protein [Armatimonadota bacterium]